MNPTYGWPLPFATATRAIRPPGLIPSRAKLSRSSTHARKCGPSTSVWNEDGLRIIGVTPVGRATVAAPRLSDDPGALEVKTQ